MDNNKAASHKKGFYEKCIKRPQDFILSLIALIVLSPVLLVTAFLVRIKLGSPVIFKQPRPGLNGKIFNMYKFRTMTDERDVEGNLLPDDKRLTKFGKVLRSTSLDELPELYCILKADMVVIGEREIIGTTKKSLIFQWFQRLELNPVMRFLCRSFRLTAEILNIRNGILDAHLTQSKEQKNLIRRFNQVHD